MDDVEVLLKIGVIITPDMSEQQRLDQAISLLKWAKETLAADTEYKIVVRQQAPASSFTPEQVEKRAEVKAAALAQREGEVSRGNAV